MPMLKNFFQKYLRKQKTRVHLPTQNNNDMKKIYCISIDGVRHEMELMASDCPGYYLYKLIPMELGYEPKVMYIAPDRADHWMYGCPMEGKQIKSSAIQYFHFYK